MESNFTTTATPIPDATEHLLYECDSCKAQIKVSTTFPKSLDGWAHVVALQVGGKIFPKGELFGMTIDIADISVSTCGGTWRRHED